MDSIVAAGLDGLYGARAGAGGGRPGGRGAGTLIAVWLRRETSALRSVGHDPPPPRPCPGGRGAGLTAWPGPARRAGVALCTLRRRDGAVQLRGRRTPNHQVQGRGSGRGGGPHRTGARDPPAAAGDDEPDGDRRGALRLRQHDQDPRSSSIASWESTHAPRPLWRGVSRAWSERLGSHPGEIRARVRCTHPSAWVNVVSTPRPQDGHDSLDDSAGTCDPD